MINQIKTSLFFFTLIAFLLSTTLGFAASNAKIFGDDNSIVLKNDPDDKDGDDKDGDDKDDDDKDDDDKDDDDKDDKGK